MHLQFLQRSVVFMVDQLTVCVPPTLTYLRWPEPRPSASGLFRFPINPQNRCDSPELENLLISLRHVWKPSPDRSAFAERPDF